ncbi:MAG TPA: hypothetical protein VLK30_11165 [Candidatus Limnocylindrales bacterium]|nr:hypothetical protein [Candidatus Limnocylindrales bacterium]
MSEELLVSRVKAALDVAPADPALRARVIQSLPLNRRQARAPLQRLAPAIAVLLAIAVVAGLVWANPFATAPGRSLRQVPLNVCQLPVWGFGPYDASSPSSYQVGFLDVSSGTFTPAPISLPWQPLPTQGLNLFAPAISYDRAAGEFVPVPASWIAPGGMSYVYLDGSDIHIRYLPSQSDRVLLPAKSLSQASLSNGGSGPYLLGWSGRLVYYATRHTYESDLWTIDPATGKNHQVVPMQSGSEWWYAGPDAVWGSAYYTGKLARYDTKTHAVSSWSLNGLVDMIGIDSSGNPIVLQGDPTTGSGRIAVMHGNGSASLLDPTSEVFKQTAFTLVADGDRIWFSATGQRLWVYSPDTSLLFLDQTSNHSLPNGLVVAGGCVSKAEVSPQSPASP